MPLWTGNKSTADVVVVGAGLIGLTIALEMHHRGARVCVVERACAMQQASHAAAGMLAVDDPSNPAELLPLSRLSVALYPGFLSRMEALSGMAVPFQTQATLQYAVDGNITRLAERSIDPRQLAAALAAAVRATPIELLEETEIESASQCGDALTLLTTTGLEVEARSVVYTAGAWTPSTVGNEFGPPIPIVPRKGQMLRVQLPPALQLDQVHRTEQIYIVPRILGPQAGTALIGATIEDAGFDTSVHAADLAQLRALAANLVPKLASQTEAPLVEAWAGLRPATPDMLPILGASADGHRFIATGHYRNGVLLAPATAAVMADLLTGKAPLVDLTAFNPKRFLR
jgi:glycine oxidase